MVDDPKAGTPEADPKVSVAAGTSEADPKGSAVGDKQQADDKDARLAKLEADLAAEKELRLKHLDKVEEANRIIAESRNRQGAQPPPTSGASSSDPLSDLTEGDIQQLQELAKSDNPIERAVAKAQLAGLRAAVVNHDLTLRSNIEAAILRQPTDDQKAIREAWESGRFRSVDDAAENVKLSKLSPLEKENEALKQRLAELSKTSGSVPPGTSPRGIGGGGAGSQDRSSVTDSEHARILSEGSDKEKWAHIMAVRRGEVRVVSD